MNTDITYANALIIAVSSGRVAIIKALIYAGADVNAQATGFPRTTIFDRAIGSGSLSMVQLCITKGAQVSPRHDFRGLWNGDRPKVTSLECAAAMGIASIIDLLLLHGADVHALAARGYQTALAAAAKNGRLDQAAKMLQHDTEPLTFKARVKAAARLAHCNRFPALAKYLENWQDKSDL